MPSVFAWNREREVHHSAGPSRADRQRRDRSEPPVFYGPPTHLEWLKKETAEAEAAFEAHQLELQDVRTIGALSYQRFHSSPEKMAYYTGLPDAAAFETLFTFLGASNETILSCRQVKAGERRMSVGGRPKKESVFPVREQLFVTLMRLRRVVVWRKKSWQTCCMSHSRQSVACSPHGLVFSIYALPLSPIGRLLKQ